MMAEAALEGNIFLDEGIERKTQRLFAPAHLGDPSIGADEVDGSLEGGGNSSSIDDDFGSEVVLFPSPFRGIIHDGSAAVLGGNVEARAILLEAEDADVGAVDSGDGSAEDANGTGADDEGPVSGAEAGVVDDGIVGDATGFGESRVFKGGEHRGRGGGSGRERE